MRLTPYSDSVSLRLHLQRLNLATYHNSLNHNAKVVSTPVAKVRRAAKTSAPQTVAATIEAEPIKRDGVIFMSGLVVDGLHYFNNDLWTATTHVFLQLP